MAERIEIESEARKSVERLDGSAFSLIDISVAEKL
jgi:hypothetical protein